MAQINAFLINKQTFIYPFVAHMQNCYNQNHQISNSFIPIYYSLRKNEKTNTF